MQWELVSTVKNYDQTILLKLKAKRCQDTRDGDPTRRSASPPSASAAAASVRLQLLVLLLATVLLHQVPIVSGRLLHVSLVFRHGHRAPIHTLPNDSHALANTWHDGLGQLTNLGKRNQLDLGKFLRARYGNFLGSRYNSSEHRLRSSNIDRTLMSAQACLAGLFPPTGDQVWQPELSWQPIPVHTVAHNSDPLLLPHDLPGCQQTFARLTAAARRVSPDRPRLQAEMADFLRQLSATVGYRQDQLTLNNVYKLIDTLMVLRAANLSQPAWAQVPDTQTRLRRLGEFSWHEFALTLELRRVRVGVLLDRLLSDMEAAAVGRLPQGGAGRRLTVYSGHDVTIVPLLAALGSPDYRVWPNYAACLMFELHSSATGRGGAAEVRIFYRNETGRDPLQLEVPGCGGPACPLDQLARLLTAYRLSPSQFRELCAHDAGHSNNGSVHSNALSINFHSILIAVAIALPIAIVLVALVHICCLHSRLLGRSDDTPPVAYHSLLGEVEN